MVIHVYYINITETGNNLNLNYYFKIYLYIKR